MQPQPLSPQTPLTPEQVEAIRRSNKLKLIWGIACLTGPTLLIILTVIAYAIVSFITSSTVDYTYASPGAVSVIVNIILFLVGAFATMAWLPGIIAGIILLVMRKPIPTMQPPVQQ